MRRVAITVGVAAVLIGAAVAVRPGLAPVTRGVSLATILVGALALVGGVRAVMGRLRGTGNRADLPEIEHRRRYPIPGDELDDRLVVLSGPPTRERDQVLHEVRERVREAAVATLVREGYSQAEARAALGAGTWSDDPRAVALFADPGDTSIQGVLEIARQREPAHRLRIERAIDDLAARHGGDGDG